MRARDLFPLLQLLLSLLLLLFQLLLDIQAERNWTTIFVTVLCVVTAQSYHLFANLAPSISFLPALPRMLNNSLHLLAGGHAAVDIAAFGSMKERLTAALNGLTTRSGNVLGSTNTFNGIRHFIRSFPHNPKIITGGNVLKHTD